MASGNSHLRWSPRCDVSLRNTAEDELAAGAQGPARASTQGSLSPAPEALQKPSPAPSQPTDDLFKQFMKAFLESSKTGAQAPRSLANASSKLGSQTCISGSCTWTATTSVSNEKIISTPLIPPGPTALRVGLLGFVEASAFVGLNTSIITCSKKAHRSPYPWTSSSPFSGRTLATPGLLWLASGASSNATLSIS